MLVTDDDFPGTRGWSEIMNLKICSLNLNQSKSTDYQ